MKLSAESLMLALRAVDQDIRRREDVLRRAELTDEQAEDESAYVLDLQKALSELSSAYEEARAGEQSLPDVDSLLGRPPAS
jgi:hypothetical protein